MDDLVEPSVKDLMTVLVDFEFDGKKLFIFEYKGRKCCLAQNLGEVLGYGEKSLPRRLLEWGDELELGEDVETLTGEDLATLKQLVAVFATGGFLGARAAQAQILYRGGIHLVLMKTNKPIGKMVREVLKKEIFPKLEDGYSIAQIGTDAQTGCTDEIFREWIGDLKMTKTLPQEVYERLLMSLHAARLNAATGVEIANHPIQTLLFSQEDVEKPVARLHDHQRKPNPDQWRSVGDIARRYGYKGAELIRRILQDVGLYQDRRGKWIELAGVSYLDMNEEHDQPYLRYHPGVVYVVLLEIWRRSRKDKRMDQDIRRKLESGNTTMWPMTTDDFVRWEKSVRVQLPKKFLEAIKEEI
jgi:hypothetical protein